MGPRSESETKMKPTRQLEITSDSISRQGRVVSREHADVDHLVQLRVLSIAGRLKATTVYISNIFAVRNSQRRRAKIVQSET
jgi:hypothetical protein